MTDDEITELAILDAKKRKKVIARELVDENAQEDSPVSLFMAGSPGAGKTEMARLIIKEFSSQYGVIPVHIENDELRKQFEAYDGLNSPLFQRPATILVEAIHDRALKRSVSFVLDSTLSNYDKAVSNIQRSLDKNRYVQIIFVYQDPEQAWKLVLAREKVEGRRVPPEVFVSQFMESQSVVSALKKYFGSNIDIMFIEKNIESTSKRPQFNVTDIDAILRKKYNREHLEAIVGQR